MNALEGLALAFLALSLVVVAAGAVLSVSAFVDLFRRRPPNLVMWCVLLVLLFPWTAFVYRAIRPDDSSSASASDSS